MVTPNIIYCLSQSAISSAFPPSRRTPYSCRQQLKGRFDGRCSCASACCCSSPSFARFAAACSPSPSSLRFRSSRSPQRMYNFSRSWLSRAVFSRRSAGSSTALPSKCCASMWLTLSQSLRGGGAFLAAARRADTSSTCKAKDHSQRREDSCQVMSIEYSDLLSSSSGEICTAKSTSLGG